MTPFRYRSRAKDFEEALTRQVAAELRHRQDDFISPQNIQRFSHGRSWKTKITETGDDGGEMRLHSFELQSHFDNVVNHDLSKFLYLKKQLVEGMTEQFQRSMYQTISESTIKSGNRISAGSDQSPAETFLAALEMIEFGVDENGDVSLPQFHGSREFIDNMIADLRAKGPEFEQRIEQVKAEKFELARQRESERLSKFPVAWK